MPANDYPIPAHYTPEQLFAVLDLLDTLRNAIRDLYQLELARDQLDMFASYDEDDRPDPDDMFF
jgi:hypothetical protein